MTTPEEMAGKRATVERRCVLCGDGMDGAEGFECKACKPPPLHVAWVDLGTMRATSDSVPYVAGAPTSSFTVSVINPGAKTSARPKPTAKAVALGESLSDVLSTALDIHETYESGERDAQTFAALGKRLVRQVARHAVLECVPAFVFEVAK